MNIQKMLVPQCSVTERHRAKTIFIRTVHAPSAASGRRTGWAQWHNDYHRPSRLVLSAATRRRRKKRGPDRPRFSQQEKRRGKNEKEENNLYYI